MAFVRVSATPNLWAGVCSERICSACFGEGLIYWDTLDDMPDRCEVCYGLGFDETLESLHLHRVRERFQVMGMWPVHIGRPGTPGHGGS